ncbi:MAG: hypothetical protein QXO57_02605 [Candidatus Aenigmatarchaeota archaeon]
MRRNLIIDIPRFHILLSSSVFFEHGFGINFRIFRYANVISIGSKVNGNNHVLFGDYEKKLTKNRLKKIREVMLKRNVFMLCFFESSKNKYHFISPQVFDFLDAIHIAKELGAERNYLSLSATREEFILRISRKGKKGQPIVYKVITNPNAFLTTEVKVAKKHYVFLQKFYKLKDLDYFFEKNLLENVKMINGVFEVEKYRTTNL